MPRASLYPYIPNRSSDSQLHDYAGPLSQRKLVDCKSTVAGQEIYDEAYVLLRAPRIMYTTRPHPAHRGGEYGQEC